MEKDLLIDKFKKALNEAKLEDLKTNEWVKWNHSWLTIGIFNHKLGDFVLKFIPQVEFSLEFNSIKHNWDSASEVEELSKIFLEHKKKLRENGAVKSDLKKLKKV